MIERRREKNRRTPLQSWGGPCEWKERLLPQETLRTTKQREERTIAGKEQGKIMQKKHLSTKESRLDEAPVSTDEILSSFTRQQDALRRGIMLRPCRGVYAEFLPAYTLSKFKRKRSLEHEGGVG